MKTIRAVRARTFIQKLCGLMFKKSFDSAFVLANCRLIHTCWMRFPIDIVAIDKDNKVLAVTADMKPWRVYCAPRGTVSIIECSTSLNCISGLEPGDELIIEYM